MANDYLAWSIILYTFAIFIVICAICVSAIIVANTVKYIKDKIREINKWG